MGTPGAAFEAFSTATTFRGITSAFFQLCLTLNVDPTDYKNIYSRIHTLECWKAQKLFKILDKKRQQGEYKGNEAAKEYNVMVIGAGPCGLRSAIECALLGTRVVVLEQRDKFSRNNVLHLWEFVIADLKSLGAKFFYPKFCTGSIEHISIRQLQCILLKVSLLFGVQVYDSVGFKQLLLPEEEGDGGYRALLEPADHILSTYEFDVLIGADGKRNTVPGFPREEMRGKLAIGITANFINKKSYEEERVPEISGVAYIFNQTFFKEMYEVTGVDLENIVYYKDETHYFVMCAKKSSLLEQGVIKNDMEDVSSLLSSSNVDEAALCRFAAAAADFATKSKLPSLEFATNQRSRPDVAMFDFTSLFSSKCSVRMVKRAGRSLLLAIVGDSLHEPFWPTGSGCARGFLGVWDTAWLIRQLAVSGRDEMELIAERESVYRLLAQVTKDNMHKNMSKYTIDPRTRYVSLDLNVRAEDVRMLVWGDGEKAAPLGSHPPSSPSLWTLLAAHRFALLTLHPYKMKMSNLSGCWRDGRALGALLAKFLPDAVEYLQLLAMEGEEKRVEHCFSIIRERTSLVLPTTEWRETSEEVVEAVVANLITWIRCDAERRRLAITPRVMSLKRRSEKGVVDASKARKTAPIERLTKDVMACYGIEERKEPLPSTSSSTPSRLSSSVRSDRTALVPPMRNQTKRPLVERLNPELVMKVEQIVTGERLKEEERRFYKDRKLEQDRAARPMDREELARMEERMGAVDRGEGKEKRENMSGREEKLMLARVPDVRREAESGFVRREMEEKYKEVDDSIRRSEQRLKQREFVGLQPIRGKSSIPPSPPRKTMTVEAVEGGEVRMRKLPPSTSSSARRVASLSMVEPAKNACGYCGKTVYLAERMIVEGLTLHRTCFKCAFCAQALRLGECTVERGLDEWRSVRMFCRTHARLPLRDKLAKIQRVERRERAGTERASSIENVESASAALQSIRETRSPVSPRRHTVTVDAPMLVIKERSEEEENKIPSRGSSTSLFFFPSDEKEEVTRIRIGEEEEVTPSLHEKTEEREKLISSIRIGLGEERGRETPERAEFEIKERKTSPHKLSPSSSLEEEEEEEEGEEMVDLDMAMDCGGDEVEMEEEEEEEEEELGEEEMEELERTVAAMDESVGEEEGGCSERQALSIIETINRRRSTVDGKEEKKQSIDNLTTVLETTDRRATVTEGELRERKIEEMNERRREARERARAKSDQQLGLENFSSTPSTYATPAGVVRGRSRSDAVTPSTSLLAPLHTPSIYSTPSEATPRRPSRLEDEGAAAAASKTAAQHSPPQGLLARLFSPSSARRLVPSPFSERKKSPAAPSSTTDPMTSSFVEGERVRVESGKEREMKGRSWKMKYSRGGDSRSEHEMDEERREESLASLSEDTKSGGGGQTTPMAIVAPNPRTSTMDSRLSTDDASIRMVQRKVERMRKQKEDDRRRTGQDIQRGLAECETRMEEVMREGTAAERRLCGDPTCTHLLEAWYSIVIERDRLRDREDDLRLRAREIAADEEYKRLKKRFNEMSLDGGEEDEDTLLQAMVEALRKRGAAKAAVDSYRDNTSRPRRDPAHVVLQRYGYNYLNFRPIFIA